MTNTNYSKDVDEYLVSLLVQHPCIYDKRDDYYKDYQRKQEAWEKIGNAMNMDGETVKRRWENLRDRFVRVYREYMVLGKSPLVRAKFKLFDRMLWLGPHIRKPRMTSSVFAMKSQMNTTQLFQDDTQNSETGETHDDVNVKTETQSNSSDMTYQEAYIEDDPILPTQQNDDVRNKSDHYFMMSVVHDCQSMPPRKKLKFKKEVLDLLEKYLYEDGKN